MNHIEYDQPDHVQYLFSEKRSDESAWIHMEIIEQANRSYPTTSLTEENGRIRQVVEIDRLNYL